MPINATGIASTCAQRVTIVELAAPHRDGSIKAYHEHLFDFDGRLDDLLDSRLG
jgi:hypothetical protein